MRLAPFVAAAVVALVGYLLYRTLSQYAFADIIAAIRAVPLQNLAMAIGWAAASYLCLTGFDFLATRYIEHPLPYLQVARNSFTSLSIGHNVGFAALSSGAIRYRFYSRAGLSVEEIAKIILFCGLTVGLGLIALAGIALVARPALGAEITGLGENTVRLIGVACIVVLAIYLALAFFLRAEVRIWRWTFEMPSARLAGAQIVIGALNFACVAACLYAIVSAIADVSWFSVASVYVLANTATLITHAPGGLGVIETVVLHLLPHANMIGAVLLFRCVYFLLPLCLGLVLFAVSELGFRWSDQNQERRERFRRKSESPG